MMPHLPVKRQVVIERRHDLPAVLARTESAAGARTLVRAVSCRGRRARPLSRRRFGRAGNRRQVEVALVPQDTAPAGHTGVEPASRP